MFRLLPGILLVLACSALKAQISISSVNYNTVSLNESTLLNAVVSNSASIVPVKAVVTCKNAAGEMILEATSRNFNLAPGINNINGATIGFNQLVYGNSGKALYLKNNGMMAAGNYSYCLKLIPLNNDESGDIYCEEFEAATDDFLNLITPYDNDTLDTKLPVLTWTHSEPFNTLAKNEYFKLVLTEIKQDQSADQAIFSNPVIYSKTFLNTHSLPYPQDAKELEDGKKYAWQVQKFSNNIMVNKTDVWAFNLKKPKTVLPHKYVLLRKTNDGGFYTATDDKLYFRFDEEYGPGDFIYEILNEQGEKLQPKVKKDDGLQKNASQQVLLNQGVNQFELSLNGYGLKKGYYTLIVLNKKKHKFYLRFYVEK